MKQLNEEKSINIQRLEYIRDKECLPPIFRKGNAKKFEITKDGTEDVIKVTTTNDKDYTIYPNMKIASNTSGEVRTFTCTGIENVGEQSNNDDDNGGDDNSPTTNWKSNFCIACTDSEGSALSTRARGLCKDVIENGGICTKFNKSKIVGELPTLKNIAGDTQSRIEKDEIVYSNGEVYLQGESRITDGEDKTFKLKKEDGEWFFYDDEKEPTAGWIKVVDYYTTSLHEQTLKEQREMKSISDKIEEKLRDIYFYTVSEKGKERVMFDLQDKKSIEQHLKDLHSQNIVGDRGFVMAVVRAKGSDKEDGQLIKLGSYPKDSNVNLGFGEEKGLGGLVGTQYFSIKNNDGPDDRDFEIVKGDINKDIEFKKEVEVEEPKEMMSQPVKEEPYEEVMKQKELKGLASLVNSDEVGNNFTKKQKEILEKLKGQGYLFKRPVEDSNYKKTKVNSSEFTESFHVWKKQN
ncbi:hypothetical protein N9145_03215 [bacterium]|nr:hypothetical protein [bacterium]